MVFVHEPEGAVHVSPEPFQSPILLAMNGEDICRLIFQLCKKVGVEAEQIKCLAYAVCTPDDFFAQGQIR